MLLSPSSATTTFPFERTATPNGVLKPLLEPYVLPASVVTTPPGYVISLMRLKLWSPTTTLPFERTATPTGYLKLAAVPVPSVKVVLPLPASVVTTPPG